MADRTPTDPAPRGADAPDHSNENPETFGAPDFTRPLAKDEAWAIWWGRPYMRIVKAPEDFKTHDPKTMWPYRGADGHRVVRVKLVPVPAEATGGTVETRIQRLILTFGGEGFVNLDEVEAEIRALVRDVAASAMGQDRDAMFERMIAEYAPPRPPEPTSGAERQEVVAWNAMVDVLNEVAPGWADDWDGSTTIDAAVKAIRALRTPPAPLPREGAMRTEIESAMRELLDIRMDDLRCPVGITDEAFAGAALGAWKRIRYAMEHLTAALTPAAPTTTKETR